MKISPFTQVLCQSVNTCPDFLTTPLPDMPQPPRHHNHPRIQHRPDVALASNFYSRQEMAADVSTSKADRHWNAVGDFERHGGVVSPYRATHLWS